MVFVEATNAVLNRGCFELGETFTAGLALKTFVLDEVAGDAVTAGGDVAAGEGELCAVGGVSPTVQAFNKTAAATTATGQ
jgi:hypothetical protein